MMTAALLSRDTRDRSPGINYLACLDHVKALPANVIVPPGYPCRES